MSHTSVLRQRPLVALLIAETVSTTGSQMTWLALPWFVLVTTGSATRMTLVMAAELIGLGLLGLPGGKLLDHLGARRTMVLSDSLRAPLMLLVPALHWAHVLGFPALLALSFGLGALSAPYFAAQKMIVPELLGEDERIVTEANALFQGATRTTLLLGPVVGGVLIGAIGAADVLVVDAATYVVSVALVAALVPATRRRRETDDARGIRAGLRFVAREPLLRVWWPAFALGDAAWTAFFATVPVLVVARFHANPRVAGLLFAAFGIGALLGNVVSYRVLLQRLDGLTLIGRFVLGQALPLWLLVLPVPAAAIAGALVLSGIANGVVNPSIHATTTLRIPAALRPTVMTSLMLGWAVAQPLGLFAAGPVLDVFGPSPVLVAFAATQTAMMTVVAVASFRLRAAPRLDPAPA